MDTRTDDRYLSDALKRHVFVSGEVDDDNGSWLDRNRRATGGEICICGLMRRNRRHFKARARSRADEHAAAQVGLGTGR